MKVNVKKQLISAAIFAVMTAVGTNMVSGKKIANTIQSYTIPNNTTLPKMIQSYNTITIKDFQNKYIKKPANNYSPECKLIGVFFDSSLKKLPKCCFQDCVLLERANLNNVEKIGDNCFLGCTKLLEVVLPSSLKVLPKCCFQGCESLISIALTNIKKIEECCFYGCINLSTVIFSKSLESLGNSCFSRCLSLQFINIKDTTIKKIEHECFSGCSNLSKLVLPQSLEYLERKCFQDCRSLISIAFISKVKMDCGCFRGCFSLQNVSVQQLVFMQNNSFIYTPFK